MEIGTGKPQTGGMIDKVREEQEEIGDRGRGKRFRRAGVLSTVGSCRMGT